MADSEPESKEDFASAESDSETSNDVVSEGTSILSSPEQTNIKSNITCATMTETTSQTETQPETEATSQTETEATSQTETEATSQTDTEATSHTETEATLQTETEATLQTDSNTSETQTHSTSGWGWGWGNITNAWSAVKGSTQASDIIDDVPSQQEIIRGTDDTECIASNQDTPTSVLGGFFSGVASAVQSTSINIVSGGLDALEVIGRKTVDMISEGDPGLRKKRALFSNEDKSLSQILKEAREINTTDNEQDESTLTLNYSHLFEQYGGIVHLEALELLSEECSQKLEVAYDSDNTGTLRDKLESLCQYFNLNEEEEEERDIGEIKVLLERFGAKLKIDNLIQVSVTARLKVPETTVDELYMVGIHSLAELCSMSIQLLKKIAELTLLPEMDQLDMKDEGESLHRVTNIMSMEFESMVSLFAEKITEKIATDETSPGVTSLYLEAANSSSYVQTAFKLILPVLQYKLLQKQ